MNRNTIIAAGTALLLAICTNGLQAQNATQPVAPTPTPASAPPPTQPPPTVRPMAPRRPMLPPRTVLSRTLLDLRQAKAMLEASKEDFGGHKASAMEAVEKATQELDAVMKSLPTPPPPQRAFQPPPAGAPGTPGAPGPVTPPPAGAPPTQPPPP